jgi:hypothetical protein
VEFGIFVPCFPFVNRDRLGAACDFQIVGVESESLRVTRSARGIEWILEQQLPFDSLYYYGSDPCGICEAARPIHVSYSPRHRQNIWAFTEGRTN